MYSLHPHFQILYSLRNIDEVRLKRAEDRQKQKEKCSNVQIFTGVALPHADARVHYYIKENTGNDETNTENTNIDCDDEAFEKPYVRTMYSQLWMYPNLQVFAYNRRLNREYMEII